MKLFTKCQQESHENAKISYIGKGKFENDYVKDKKYCKVRDYCHYTEHAIKIISFKMKKWSYLQKSSNNHMKMQNQLYW